MTGRIPTCFFSAELRGQLQKFALALGHLPPLVVDVTVREHVTELQKERGKSEEDYQARLQELDRRKVSRGSGQGCSYRHSWLLLLEGSQSFCTPCCSRRSHRPRIAGLKTD